jgi:uncharacterized protein (TIGR02118 family)
VQILNRRVPRDTRRRESDDKVIVLLPRRAGRGQEEFRRYLDEKRFRLVKCLPGLQRLVAGYAMSAPGGTASAYDAVAGDWVESPLAMQAAFASPQGQVVCAGTPNFADVDRVALLAVQESTIVPG